MCCICVNCRAYLGVAYVLYMCLGLAPAIFHNFNQFPQHTLLNNTRGLLNFIQYLQKPTLPPKTPIKSL